MSERLSDDEDAAWISTPSPDHESLSPSDTTSLSPANNSSHAGHRNLIAQQPNSDRSAEEDIEMRTLDESGAEQPLLHASHIGDSDADIEPAFAHRPAEPSDSTDDEATFGLSLFTWILTLTASLSGLLFGYDTGVISSTLVSIGTSLSHRTLTSWDKSLITSCTALFALFASPVTGVVADAWGRKKVILVADCLFVLGALAQAQASSVGGMVVGRSLVGVAVGAASAVVPLYISELAPTPFRGRLVTISTLCITGGQVIAYIVGFVLSTHAHGWRWMVGLGALPAAVQFLVLGFMPETPRWLVRRERSDEAHAVLRRIYGYRRLQQESGHLAEENDRKAGVAEMVLRRVEREVMEEVELEVNRRRHLEAPKQGWFSLRVEEAQERVAELVTMDGNRRALIIACGLQGLQQLCGFNSFMYFSATIFALIGFSSPTLPALSVAIANFVFTLVAFQTIDRLGRRRTLLFSIPLMVLGLVGAAVSFSFVDLNEPSSEVSLSSSNNLPAIMIVFSTVVYVAAYALGLGNIPWHQSELFPLSVRALGSGLATATNWLSNFIVGLTFLLLVQGVGPSFTFGIYAVVCAFGWVVAWWIYPETCGMGLEEVGGLLKDGWGVSREQRRMWWKAARSSRGRTAPFD